MRGLSRTMPSAAEVTPITPWTPGLVAVLAALVVGLAAPVVLIVREPGGLAFVVGWVAVLSTWAWWGGRRSRAFARERSGGSICAFAREFDRRAVDPWVIRAVWEETQDLLGRADAPVRLRAADRLRGEWGVEPDDLGDLWEVVARRAGRSLAHTERNPSWGRVETVGDLVRFVSAQPLVAADPLAD